MSNELSGKIALVTGGDRGIGRAIAEEFAEAGADVAVNYFSKAEAAAEVARAIKHCGRRALAVQADVSKSEEVRRMIEAVENSLGSVDILVNNAGIARLQKLDDISENDWDEVLAVNLKSAFMVTQTVLPGMRTRRWGRIINISSVAAQRGGVTGPHYAASKAGMHGLTHSYANLLIKEGITANAIAPALIETDMVRANPLVTPTLIPMGRFGTVEEVASIALMLASNGYITGQTISINGGWYMT